MVWFLVVFVLLVVGEILLLKTHSKGSVVLDRYTKEKSDVKMDSIESLQEQLKSLGSNITGISCEQNRVKFNFHKNNYAICYETDVVYAEYDMNWTGIRISGVARLLQFFKFCKAVRKAGELNYVMDRLAGRDPAEGLKAAQKVKRYKTAITLAFGGMILSLFIGLFGLTGGGTEGNGGLVGETYGKAIQNVKDTVYSTNVTYGDIVGGYLTSPKWEAFNDSEKAVAIVEVNGKSINDEKICIQFMGELGLEFYQVENQVFKPVYVEVEGEAVVVDEAFDYMYTAIQ